MISIEGTAVAPGDLIGKDKMGHIRLCEASRSNPPGARAMHPVTTA
jgi:hypothetical protein